MGTFNNDDNENILVRLLMSGLGRKRTFGNDITSSPMTFVQVQSSREGHSTRVRRWGSMIRAFILALGDLSDRRILAVLFQALAITAIIFLLLGALLIWLLSGADPCAWVSAASCPLGGVAGGVSAVAMTVVGVWLLFPGVAIGVVTGFADRIAAAVELRHYPDAAATARPVGISTGIGMGLRSASRLLLFNLLALPFYLLLLVTGVGPFLLFVIVNGLAFGRDLGELAAARHGDRHSRRTWLKITRGQQNVMGTVVSFMFLVPFVNLIAPVVGTAMAIHLFNRSEAIPPRSGIPARQGN